MKTRLTTSLALLAAALLSATIFAADDGKKEHGGHGKDPMAAHLSKLSGDEFEAAYLAMMIHHHQGGVKMAKMAVEKAQSPELKAMMQKAAAEQQGEIEQMTGWLQQWHKKSPQAHPMPEAMMKMMQKDMAELQGLEGKEFDKSFAKKMAHHHTGAIEMARLAVDKAEHKEVKELSQRIIDSQSKEHKELLAIAGGKGAEKSDKKD
jgi:uncharacterized protein (DUF305 family)